MPPEWIEALKIGGPLAVVLGGFAWLFITDIIAPTASFKRQLEAKDKVIAQVRADCDQVRKDKDAEIARTRVSTDAEIARLEERNAELWSYIKLAMGLMDESRDTAKAAVEKGEAAISVARTARRRTGS
jgi:hypothetical protein